VLDIAGFPNGLTNEHILRVQRLRVVTLQSHNLLRDEARHGGDVFIRIRGVLHYLWRAVDQHGVVLDILLQERRNGATAKRFFKQLLRGMRYKPRQAGT
jgi:transposase-like protein